MTNETDPAALRRAFNRAAETFPASVSAFLDQTKPGREQLALLTAWWGQLYTAIRDTTAGLKLLAELEKGNK